MSPAGPRALGQDAAVAAVCRLVRARPGQTVLIGIDGGGGAGKTRFAARLAAALGDAAVVHVDDFSAPSIPEWDWERFREQVLHPLLAGRRARYQRWGWHLDAPAEWHDIAPGRPVIVEGVSATRREVGAPWAVRIWVDAPEPVRLHRVLERDGAGMLPVWREQWLPSERAYVARENPLGRVDLVVRGTEP